MVVTFQGSRQLSCNESAKNVTDTELNAKGNKKLKSARKDDTFIPLHCDLSSVLQRFIFIDNEVTS